MLDRYLGREGACCSPTASLQFNDIATVAEHHSFRQCPRIPLGILHRADLRPYGCTRESRGALQGISRHSLVVAIK